ncbi:unnamed protein product [Phaeothamnion confervicola]
MAMEIDKPFMEDVKSKSTALFQEAPEHIRARACGTKEEYAKVVDKYDSWLLDCDGVIWRGGETLPAAVEAVKELMEKKVLFVTNDSRKSRKQYQEKLLGMGIPADESDVVPSSFMAADYLKQKHPECKKAFVIGEQGLCDELELHGVQTLGAQQPGFADAARFLEEDFASAELDPDVGAVVVGWDLSFSYKKLCLASLYLQRNPGCVFVSCAPDAVDMQPNGQIPGNGPLTAAVAATVEQEPVLVGKPGEWLAKRIIELHGLKPEQTVMVGDNLNSDVKAGLAGGIATLLVLTGRTAPDDVKKLPEKDTDILPDHIVPALGIFVEGPHTDAASHGASAGASSAAGNE